ATKERPGRVEPLAESFERLPEGGPHELIPAHRERHDEHPELAPLALSNANVANVTEVHLGFFASRWIVNEDGRRTLSPPQLVVRVSPQRGVRYIDTIAAQQFVDAHQLERSLLPQPCFDAGAMLIQQPSRLRTLGLRP